MTEPPTDRSRTAGDPSRYAPRTLAIVGFGRFGQLLARILRDHFEIRIHDRAERSSEAAAAGVTVVDLEAACAADVVILAVPIAALEGAARAVAPLVAPGCTLMDVCSVKVHPQDVFRRHLAGRGAELVLTHPLWGPDSASGGLAGLPIALHDLETSPGVFDYWVRLFERLGLSTVVITPEDHDRQAAYSQGLTHLVGRVLEAMRLSQSPVSTTGFRALLEVRNQTCNDTWELFEDLQSYNPYTGEMRRDLMAQLASVSAALDRDA